MMTFSEVKTRLAGMGVVAKKTEDGEYRVNLKGGKEATAYYTTDLYDALATGRIMGTADSAKGER